MRARTFLAMLGLVFFFAVGLLAGRQLVKMGNTDAISGPDATIEYTLEDLYTRLIEGTMDNVQMGTFEEPQVAPGTGTMHTIQDLMLIAPGFIDHGDGTVTDLRTGLMWAKDAGHRPANHQAAIDYCSSLVLAGYDDWSVSAVTQVAGLLDPREGSVVRNGHPFLNVSESYWGKHTFFSNGLQHALVIHLSKADYDPMQLSNVLVDADMLPIHVWPVRGP